MIRNMLDALETGLQVKIVVDGTDNYIARSVLGTTLAEEKWSILKTDTDGNVFYPIDEKTGLPSLAFRFSPNDYASYIFQYGPYTTVPSIDVFTINTGDLTTSIRDVSIEITVTSGINIESYSISEDEFNNVFVQQKPTSFTLSEGLGVKTIYLKVKDVYGNISTSTATIELV